MVGGITRAMTRTYTLQWDGQSVTADADTSLLKSLLRAGKPVSYGCGSGQCGACRLRLIEGDVDAPATQTLSPAQRAAGEILSCQARPRSNVRVQSVTPTAGDAETYNGTITRVERPTPDLVKLRVRLEGVLDFHPGQYGLLRTHYGPARPYSLANPPGQGVVEFHIRAVTGGKAGPQIYAQAKRGDRVELTAPMGDAYAPDLNRPIALIATGTGMAPMKSVLAYLRQREHRSPVRVLWGNRNPDDCYDMAAFEALVEGFEDAQFLPVFSAGAGGTRVTDHLRALAPSLLGWTVFCAGNPQMVRDVAQQLALMGLAPHDFHADPFTHAED